MIDTKELRRLAQAATPHVGHACKYQDAHWLREGHVDFENADLFIASERPHEDAAFYAAANPAAVSELLDRLEAAEKERDDVAQQLVQSEVGKREISEARDALQVEVGKLKDLEVSRCVKINGYIVDNARLGEEVERLRAELSKQQALTDAAQHIAEVAQSRANQLQVKITEMERQEPVAWIRERDDHRRRKLSFEKPVNSSPDKLHWSPLYALPGAQPAPSVPNGWKLVPIEPTPSMAASIELSTANSVSEIYRAMLAATPEAKP